MARGQNLVKWEVWRRRLRAFDREDTPVTRFCQREGVSVATFYLWRRKLAEEASTPSLLGATAKVRLGAPSSVRSRRSAVQHARNSGVLKSRRGRLGAWALCLFPSRHSPAWKCGCPAAHASWSPATIARRSTP